MADPNDIANTQIKIHSNFTISDGTSSSVFATTDAVYTPATFASKLTTDLTGNTVTVGSDVTLTGDGTDFYRIYLQFANAATLTGMPAYIFTVPFSDFSVGAGGQVNLRNVNLDAQMTIAASYTTILPFGQLGTDIDGLDANELSGYSVAQSSDGSIVAIGAYGHDGQKGTTRIYQNITGTWTQLGSDIDGTDAGERSGFSVSLSSDGTIVAIGAHYHDGSKGTTRIYTYSTPGLIGGSWTQIGSDIDGTDASEYSGYSVSLSSDGTIVAIGAYQHDGQKGTTRIYQNITGTWTQIGSDIDGSGAIEYSGISVSLSSDGTTVAIGAHYHDGQKGTTRIYKNITGTWTQIGSDIDGTDAGEYSGFSVSLISDGSIVAIGANVHDGGKGTTRIYQLPTTISSSNTSTIPAGNNFINNFVSTIETDLVDYTLLYDASNALITFDGLAQDISMSITSTDTTVFDTSITEITTAANTLPFITYGQPDPTLQNYIDNGITTGEFVSNGYTVTQLLSGSVIPDWNVDTDGNHFDQSYLKGFTDVSGSVVIRNDNRLITNGDLSLGGNLITSGTTSLVIDDMTLKSQLLMGEDISANGNVYIGGDLSVNGQFSGDFANNSIPQSAIIFNPIDISGNAIFIDDVSFNGPTVDVSNTLPVNQIEFNDGTTMTTHDDNILSGTFADSNVVFKDSTFASVICEGVAEANSTTTSDYRIKENVTGLNETDTVDALIPIQYNNTMSGNHEFGLLAHELQEIYPDLVNGEKDGDEYQRVHYNGLIGVLVKEVQDIKQRLAVLNNR